MAQILRECDALGKLQKEVGSLEAVRAVLGDGWELEKIPQQDDGHTAEEFRAATNHLEQMVDLGQCLRV